jgi:large subunit ribosomal protein L15
VPHKLRKTRKRRGSRTQGWGRVGQHRRTGSKGRRNPGRHKALWSYVIKYEPGYYGKDGFTSPKSLRQEARVINVGSLDEIVDKFAVERGEGKRFIDLEGLGYTKLLGTGKVSKALVVKVPAFSKSAAEKIKDAGGQILEEKQGTGE